MRRGSRREFRGRSVALSIKKVDGVERMVRKDDAGRTHAWTVASGLRHGSSDERRVFFTPCWKIDPNRTFDPSPHHVSCRFPMATIAKPRPTNACAGRTGRRDSHGRSDGTCSARADERKAWTRDQVCGVSVREGAGGSVWVDQGLGGGQKRLFPAPQHLGR